MKKVKRGKDDQKRDNKKRKADILHIQYNRKNRRIVKKRKDCERKRIR